MCNIKNTFFVLLFVMLMGCSSSENEVKHVTISNLVGLWDSSEKDGSKTDVIYTRISSTGDIIEYDFDGDEVDLGLSCYQVNTGKIIPVSGNLFRITNDMKKDKTLDVELEMLDAGYALKLYFLKPASENENSSDAWNAYSSQIWTRMRNSALLDKEPSCSDK